jgi:hypothetical protein
MRRAALAAPPDRLGGLAERIVAAPDSTGRIDRVAPARSERRFSTGKEGFSTGIGKGGAKDGTSEDEAARVCSRRSTSRAAKIAATMTSRASHFQDEADRSELARRRRFRHSVRTEQAPNHSSGSE